MTRATAAELAGCPELLSLFGELLYLVDVIQPRPLGNLLRPDLPARGHTSDVRTRASVDLRCLDCRAELSAGWQFDWHIHRSERIAFGVWV